VAPDSKIYVAGHRGLAGSAIVRRLRAKGYSNVVTRTHAELDLVDQRAVREFLGRERPEAVFLAAGKVGGILANNSFPADFIFQNLAIESNVIDAAYRAGVQRLVFLGSSCIYPRDCPQPMKEEYLLTGPLEPTNRPYAIAKIAGLEMCWSYNRQYGTRYFCAMPTNLYGPGDNFGLESSHVLPALIRKFHEARREGKGSVVIWGTGTPRREFLYVDDLADAVVFLTQNYSGAGLINVGVGADVTIRELAERIGKIVGFQGELVFDGTKPDGTPRKLLNVNRLLKLGWRAKTSLDEGLRRTYDWFCANEAQSRR